jgi:uncharacterized protein (DUF4415 family)
VSQQRIKAVQYFTDEYLAQCRTATPKQILIFLETYRLMQVSEEKTKLISIKIPESLLAAFRQKCDLTGVKYQTKIKALMRHWLQE